MENGEEQARADKSRQEARTKDRRGKEQRGSGGTGARLCNNACMPEGAVLGTKVQAAMLVILDSCWPDLTAQYKYIVPVDPVNSAVFFVRSTMYLYQYSVRSVCLYSIFPFISFHCFNACEHHGSLRWDGCYWPVVVVGHCAGARSDGQCFVFGFVFWICLRDVEIYSVLSIPL